MISFQEGSGGEDEKGADLAKFLRRLHSTTANGELLLSCIRQVMLEAWVGTVQGPNGLAEVRREYFCLVRVEVAFIR